MPTLEQRIERLERSQSRWKSAFFLLFGAMLVAGAAASQSGNFDHLSARSMTISSGPGSPAILLESGADGASIGLFAKSAGSAAEQKSSVALRVDAGTAHVVLSHETPRGNCGATINVDSETSSVDVHNAGGKSKSLDAD